MKKSKYIHLKESIINDWRIYRSKNSQKVWKKVTLAKIVADKRFMITFNNQNKNNLQVI